MIHFLARGSNSRNRCVRFPPECCLSVTVYYRETDVTVCDTDRESIPPVSPLETEPLDSWQLRLDEWGVGIFHHLRGCLTVHRAARQEFRHKSLIVAFERNCDGAYRWHCRLASLPRGSVCRIERAPPELLENNVNDKTTIENAQQSRQGRKKLQRQPYGGSI